MKILEPNSTADYEFTVIVPVYNEEDNLAALEKSLEEYLKVAVMRTCTLLVDDGSTDRSRERIAEICSKHKEFFYIAFEHNCGKSAALRAGFEATQSPYVGYMDADLQTVPEDFNLLLGQIGDCEMVTGIRANRKDTWFYKFQSKVGNGFRRMFTHDGVTDTGCPLKVIRTEYAKRMPMFEGMHRFLPALIIMQDGRVKQLPVRHFPRTAGVSKYSLWNRLIGPLNDCFAYRWMKKRYFNFRVAADNLGLTVPDNGGDMSEKMIENQDF